jgi:singapore isolate B (sub-type 7) whole genome shotgun sequence assembly, scaffold_22
LHDETTGNGNDHSIDVIFCCGISKEWYLVGEKENGNRKDDIQQQGGLDSFLSEYSTKGSISRKIYGGKEYEIEQYQGDHADEYCIFEMNNGVRDGTAELFDDGMVKMRWRMKKGKEDGCYTVYDKGIAVREGKWNSFGNNEERVIENRRQGLLMVIRIAGEVVFEGQYNKSLQRSGLGYEYENGRLNRYGRWEKDTLVELYQRFANENMIEYSEGSNTDLLSHRPVYYGGYTLDENSGLIKRNGNGRVLNKETGMCEYESEWMNGIENENKRLPLCNGWYSEYTSGISTRGVVNGDESMIVCKNIGLKVSNTVEEIIIANNECNEWNMKSLILSDYSNLKRLNIGNNCYKCTRYFIIDGLNELETLTVGNSCFTYVKLVDDFSFFAERTDGVFRITNCSKLSSIQIGDYSFAEYHSLLLGSLPSLECIAFKKSSFYFMPRLELTSIVIRLLDHDKTFLSFSLLPLIRNRLCSFSRLYLRVENPEIVIR